MSQVSSFPIHPNFFRTVFNSCYCCVFYFLMILYSFPIIIFSSVLCNSQSYFVLSGISFLSISVFYLALISVLSVFFQRDPYLLILNLGSTTSSFGPFSILSLVLFFSLKLSDAKYSCLHLDFFNQIYFSRTCLRQCLLV